MNRMTGKSRLGIAAAFTLAERSIEHHQYGTLFALYFGDNVHRSLKSHLPDRLRLSAINQTAHIVPLGMRGDAGINHLVIFAGGRLSSVCHLFEDRGISCVSETSCHPGVIQPTTFEYPVK